ncbi:hypothetical protein KQI84_14315 [bacterium]|nr:hypothetical protein [bacterium]
MIAPRDVFGAIRGIAVKTVRPTATGFAIAALVGGLGCATAPRTDSSATGMTLAEASAAMAESGALNDYIFTRTKVGRHTFPKYPDKAWEWFCERRLDDGMKKLPDFYRQEAMLVTQKNNMDRRTLRANAQWTFLGPDGTTVQPSGRLIEMVVHPQDQNTIWGASASGGVWKTTDQGVTWANVTDGSLPTIGMGSLQIDPHNYNRLYCGLGEGVPGSFYEPFGAGVYRSTDGGSSWSIVSGTNVMNYVTDIDIGANSDTLLVAAKGSGGTGAGFYRTTNGGTNWTAVSSDPFFDISVDPANRNNVVVTRGYNTVNAASGAIFYSTDGGATLSPSTTPSTTNAFRIELARNGTTVYALVGATDSSILGIWKSTNNGQSFSAMSTSGIPTSGDYKPGQMTYNCSIGVSPTDANVIYVGSNLRMYRTTNGGTSWAAVTDWAGEGGLKYIHADHHSIRFGSTGSTVYMGTDGGFFVSTDSGANWTERNVHMTSTQCYRIDCDPQNAQRVIIGCQDNDKYVRRTDGTWHHYPNAFGDCMEVIAWPNDPSTYMGCNYYASAVRLTPDDGANWYFLRSYGTSNNGIPDAEKGAWVTPFFIDPQNPKDIYMGVNGVYKGTYNGINQPFSWTNLIAPNTSYSPASLDTLTITNGMTGRKLVGFRARRNNSTGQLGVELFRSNTNGTSIESLTLPYLGWISDIECDPSDNDTFWMTYSNLGLGTGSRGRIYKTTDLGTTFHDMTNNFPQDLPANALWIDPTNSNTIIVGSDIGAYRSDDGGNTWVYWNDGLPPVVITDMAYLANGRKLRAGTYGRGIWETPLDSQGGSPSIRIEPSTLQFP